MALPLQAVHDPTSDQNFRLVGERFPIGIADLEKGILLQLATAGTARKVAFGANEVEFAGGTTTSEALVVTHGLGATPIAVIGNVKHESGYAYNVGTYAYTATQFTVKAGNIEGGTPVAGTKLIVTWIAIG